MIDADRHFMRRALALARLGLGLASPNPSVGCVIVRNGRIVGEAFHDYSQIVHAESRAVRQAGSKARGATAYVTLEPCTHRGRTPPCADLLVESGVRRVVLALRDPNPKVYGKGIELLRRAGIRVESGLFEREGARIIEPFACHVRTGLPLVVGKVGMTLDGRIAAPGKRVDWISSEEARSFGQTLRLQLDAILVGVGTVLNDDPQLTYRGRARKVRPLVRVVLDSWLRTPPAARIFPAGPQSPTIIFCSAGASGIQRRALEEKGAEIIRVPCVEGKLDLHAVLRQLGRRNILGLLVEGGSAVHWSFISAELVDKFYFNLAPLILGGSRAIPAVGGEGYGTVRQAPRFEIAQQFRAGSDLILETYPRYSRSILSPGRPSASFPSRAQYPRHPSVQR